MKAHRRRRRTAAARRTCLGGPPQRRRRGGLWEHRRGCGGGAEVEWFGQGAWEERKKKRGDARGSEVLCLWHGGRLREAGEDAQHGSVLSQETLVHPPQALDLSQSRESLHRERRTERSRERQTHEACKEAGQRDREKKRRAGLNTTPTRTDTDTRGEEKGNF